MAVDRIRVVWEPSNGAGAIEFNDDPDAALFLLNLVGFLSNRASPVTMKSPGQRGTSLTDVSVEPRTLSLNAWLTAPDNVTIWERREELAASLVVEPSATERPEPGVIRVYRSGLPTREIEAYPVDSPQDQWLAETTVNIDIEWLAPYPYFRALEDETADLVPAGGFEFPIEFPFEIVSDAVSATVDNIGTVSVPVVIRVDGEVDTPRIENITTGEIIEIETILDTGEYALINTGYGTKTIVRYPDEANIISFVNLDAVDFWRLRPGENVIRFTANATGSGAAVSISWRPQWAGI